MKRILVCEDEDVIRDFVVINLKRAGYDVIDVNCGEEALRVFENEHGNFDVALLDLMMPGIDGFTVCKKLREKSSTLGIIMLSAKTQEMDKVSGLMIGADDYMTKPFSQRELVARIKAVLRRSNVLAGNGEELALGRLRMNFSQYEAWLDNEKLELTPKEYEMLKLLAENAGKVFSREQLLEKIWGYEYFGDTRTVDVHVRHLRAKLERVPEMAEAIETVRGVGYRLAK